MVRLSCTKRTREMGSSIQDRTEARQRLSCRPADHAECRSMNMSLLQGLQFSSCRCPDTSAWSILRLKVGRAGVPLGRLPPPRLVGTVIWVMSRYGEFDICPAGCLSRACMGLREAHCCPLGSSCRAFSTQGSRRRLKLLKSHANAQSVSDGVKTYVPRQDWDVQRRRMIDGIWEYLIWPREGEEW